MKPVTWAFLLVLICIPLRTLILPALRQKQGAIFLTVQFFGPGRSAHVEINDKPVDDYNPYPYFKELNAYLSTGENTSNPAPICPFEIPRPPAASFWRMPVYVDFIDPNAAFGSGYWQFIYHH